MDWVLWLIGGMLSILLGLFLIFTTAKLIGYGYEKGKTSFREDHRRKEESNGHQEAY